MDKNTAVKELKNLSIAMSFTTDNKIPNFTFRSNRATTIVCREIADFIEQQAKNVNPDGSDCMPGYCKLCCGIDSVRSKEITELKIQIKQQAQQIQAMRNCDNCDHELLCEIRPQVKECNNFDKWEWDGGSGE